MNDGYKPLHRYTRSYAHHRLFHNSQVQDSIRKGCVVLVEETVAYFGQHHYQPLIVGHKLLKRFYHLLSHIHCTSTLLGPAKYPISATTAVGRVLSLYESDS